MPEVITTIEDTPADTAGLVAGDLIVEIEGKSTVGKPLWEVVDQLRGVPGTAVNLSIRREGIPDPIPHAIVRAEIRVNSVTYSEEIEPGIGYIGMARTRFSEETGQEVEAALQDLSGRDSRGLILDLRGNPGGLLSQAREVADKFLDPGQLIVATKGRVPDQSKEYRARGPNILGKAVPLIVLVDQGSASASEIAAGAIQDADRGLILGAPTFGKGSVQTVVRVDDETALKLTTALYYTPSGRSIHRSSGPADATLSVDDREIPVHVLIDIIARSADSGDARSAVVTKFGLTPPQADRVLDFSISRLAGLALQRARADSTGNHTQFKTAGGRPVYGGGGITPDVVVEPESPPPLFTQLSYQRLFLAFASRYAAVHRGVTRPFVADSSVVGEFRAFLADSAQGFTYRPPSEVRLDDIEKAFDGQGVSGETKAALEVLRRDCRQELEAEFVKADDLIRAAIERQVASRLWGSRAEIEAGLKWDVQLQEAIRILKDPELYRQKMGMPRMASGKDASNSGNKPEGPAPEQ